MAKPKRSTEPGSESLAQPALQRAPGKSDETSVAKRPSASQPTSPERRHRREAASAPPTSEATFRALVEDLPDVIVRYDSQCRRIYVNRAYREIAQLPAEGLLGNTPTQRSPLDPASAAALQSLVRQVLKRGVPAELDLYWPKAPNIRLCHAVRAVPEFGADGRVVSVMTIGRDITERKRAEEERIVHLRFFETMDRVNRAIQGSSDLEEVMREVLEVALADFGADRVWLCYPCDLQATTCTVPMERTRPEYPGALAQGVVFPADAEILATFRAVLAAGQPVPFGEGAELPLAQGAVRGFGIKSMLATVVYPKGDKPYLFGMHQCSRVRAWTPAEQTLFQAIARRLADALTTLLAYRDLERRVAERTAQLEAANKELEAFVYSVSHDLRSPLRCVDSFSHILAEDYSAQLDAQGQDNLQRICAASARMGQLIDDLLKLSRVSRDEMHPGCVDLSALGLSVLNHLRLTDPARPVEVVIASGLQAKGDERLLQIAMENLLGNAWKFTSRQPAARIELGRCAPAAGAAFFVRDNGAGFEMAFATKLFGAFQRLHSEAEFPGTGIGLATVQRIIHRHGGQVWAESKPGEGATFYFTLPE